MLAFPKIKNNKQTPNIPKKVKIKYIYAPIHIKP